MRFIWRSEWVLWRGGVDLVVEDCRIRASWSARCSGSARMCGDREGEVVVREVGHGRQATRVSGPLPNSDTAFKRMKYGSAREGG